MVLVTEMQYFPLINNYVDMLNVSNVYFIQDAIFKKSTFRNRMVISSSTGPIELSIPIVGGRNCKQMYNEVEIDYKTDWQSLHLKSICTAYGKAPWFSHYHAELTELYNTRFTTLASWNFNCIEWVNKKLKIDTQIKIQSIEPTDDPQVLNRADFYKPSNYSQISINSIINYTQVFQYRNGFQVNLSILDLLLNEGPNARNLILASKKTYSVRNQ